MTHPMAMAQEKNVLGQNSNWVMWMKPVILKRMMNRRLTAMLGR
jgi:hypothetical protein